MPTWILTGGADNFPNAGANPPQFNTGQDVVNGAGGNDIIHGGAMNDSLHGEGDNDTIHGGADDDIITGDQGNDVLFGDDGNDLLVDGGDGNDVVRGGIGNDLLVGGKGSDDVRGGDGNDQIGSAVHEQGEPQVGDVDIYLGEDGNDVLETVNLPTGAKATFNGGAGTDTVRSTGSLAGYTFISAEVLENAYQIRATTAQINLFPLITDSYSFSDVTDIFLTSGGTVNFSAKIAPGIKLKVHCSDVFGNTVIGGANDDELRVDIFNPSGGAVNLDGRGGNDRLLGSARNDLLQGGLGNDYLYGSVGFDTASYSQATAGVVVSLANGAAQNTVGAGIDTLDIGSIEALLGSTHNDTLTASNFGCTLTGGGGNDTLRGGNASDILVGGVGTDSLRGGLGNDTYVLENGVDGIIDTGGVDTATSTVSRSIAPYATLDNLTLVNVAAALSGTGNNLANTITGNNFNNTLNGGNGNDRLNGGLGNDSLIGGVGNDVLNGSTGNDTLTGGAGVDTLTGGANNDFFVFNAPLNAANRDVVTDFFAPQDTFRLENAVMAGLGVAGALSANRFFAGAAAHDADDRVIYNKVNGALSYDSNGSAAGGVTVLATLTNKPVLTAADFVVI
jgi:serralysin